MAPPERFDFPQIIEVLNRHQVDYVVIGGMAAVLQGAPTNTIDVDALVRYDQKNLKRLGGALRELGAQRSTDVDSFISRIEEFPTEAGTVDILRAAEGIGTYDDVVPNTTILMVEDEEVRTLDLPTLIQSKEATFGENDRYHLTHLYRLADELGVRHRSLEAVERDHRQRGRDDNPWDR